MNRLPNVDFVQPGELSLPIAKGYVPFALRAGDDNNFGPEDWAWQFLRLNSNYAEAYRSRLDLWGKDGNYRSRGYCQNTFGLSDWLAPTNLRLPRRTRGQSQFYPLICANPSAECAVIPEPVLGTYGYQFHRVQLQSIRLPRNASPYIWFAVDCSVPVSGQIVAIEKLVPLYRRWFEHAYDGQILKKAIPNVIAKLADCQWFDVKDYEHAAGATDKMRFSVDAWRAVCINVLGPLKQQTEFYKAQLAKEYASLVESCLVKRSIMDRFSAQPRHPVKVHDTVLTDGFWLKGLVVVAQLAKRNYSIQEIAHYIAQQGSTMHLATNSGADSANLSLDLQRERNVAWDDWTANREERIGKYLKKAQAFINGEYRWLIHAQKP